MADNSKTATSGSTQYLVEVLARRKFLDKKTLYEKRVLVGVVVLLILFIAFFIAFLVVQKQYNNLLASRVCSSKECIESSIMLAQSVDMSENPCDDFYKFACGRFHLDHPVSPIYMHSSWFLEKESKLDHMVQSILQQEIAASDLKSVKYAKNFFNACVNRSALDALGLQPLYDLLNLVDLPRAIPTSQHKEQFSIAKTLALAQKYLSQDIIIGLSITKGISNGTDSHRNSTMIQISPNVGKSLGLEYMLRHDDLPKGRDNHLSSLSSRELVLTTLKFIAQVMAAISDDLDENHGVENQYNASHFTTLAFKVITFTSELLQTDELRGKSARSRDQVTISELQAVLDGETDSRDAYNRIDWKEYAEILLKGTNNSFDIENDEIVVQNLDYFKFLTKLIGFSKPETIQRYIWWEIVEEFGRHTTSEMSAIYRRYYEKLYAEEGIVPRAEVCTKMTKNMMDVALSYEMSKINNFSGDISKIQEMLHDIQGVFMTMVSSVSWMDSLTKTSTLDKAQSITDNIGYPTWIFEEQKIMEYYEGLELKESDFLMNIVRHKSWEVKEGLELVGKDETQTAKAFFMNPLQVNAFYLRTENSITIPAGILQSPFYFRGLESLNYGAIGTILGHELTHGFDIEGKDYNKFGEVQEDLWPNKVTIEYLNRAECFVNQYGNFQLSSTKRLNGSYTLAENIADNGGMRESYKAYKQYASRHGQEPLLPGFENFTHDQLLFMSFANIWCESSTSEYKQLVSGDSHSPHRIRVVATLQNMKEFSNAFQCPSGSFMNPNKKCIIW